MYIIVGAGIAGLTVAEGLLDKGHKVTLLERYPKVGGRIATFRASNQQYEMGAGRIHSNHKRVQALIKRFKLHTYPIDDYVVYRPLATGIEEPTGHTWIFPAILKMLDTVPAKTLASHTLYDLLSPEWRALMTRFPYWAEVNLLRADLAAESFRAEMKTYGGFVGIMEGIDALTEHLRGVVERKGGKILTRHRVSDVRKVRDGFEILGDSGKKADATPFSIHATHVILATCRCSLGKFSVLKKLPLLQQLQTSPLVRIYATYSTPAWFHGIPKTVTDSPLRFIIPIDEKKGQIMISYTDGPDTKKWIDLEEGALKSAIHKETQTLFGTVPAPIEIQKFPWPGGCTYWTPGEYDVDEAIDAAMHPVENLWVVGESVARHQAWIESALTTAETLLRRLS